MHIEFKEAVIPQCLTIQLLYRGGGIVEACALTMLHTCDESRGCGLCWNERHHYGEYNWSAVTPPPISRKYTM